MLHMPNGKSDSPPSLCFCVPYPSCRAGNTRHECADMGMDKLGGALPRRAQPTSSALACTCGAHKTGQHPCGPGAAAQAWSLLVLRVPSAPHDGRASWPRSLGLAVATALQLQSCRQTSPACIFKKYIQPCPQPTLASPCASPCASLHASLRSASASPPLLLIVLLVLVL